jgi:hypothetical protein
MALAPRRARLNILDLAIYKNHWKTNYEMIAYHYFYI